MSTTQLTEWAYPLAESLLAEPLPRRWKHSLGVAERARSLAPVLGSDSDLMEAKDCVRHASTCPQRKGGGLVFTRPKTKKSRNAVPIPPPFIPALLEHREQQNEARTAAGDLWQEHDVLFSRPDGRPLDPRQDWQEFKELLEEASISDRRLYDGSRHTAGTILNELGVDMPTIMEILRHTQISQTRRYVKGRSTLSKDAMQRMGDAFIPRPGPTTETRTETTASRAARARRRRIR